MKKLGKVFATLAAVAMLGTGFIACSGDDDGPSGPSDSGVISITAPSAAGAVKLVADSESATALYEGTSVQSALEYLMTNSSTGSYTITVAPGTYNEMLFYTGSAKITIAGTGTAAYGTDVLITYSNSGNSDAMQTLAASHGVTSGYFRGTNRFDGSCTVVLKNITLRNSYSRSANDGSSTQAEALVYTSSGNLIAYNSSFLSHQDTLYLGNKNNSRMWFYKDYIAGDVDFIWGYMDVALFEECSIYCRGDETDKAYIFASRAVTESAANKGIVLLNNKIEIGKGVTAWYGRNSGDDTQAAILNSTITGAGSINSELYQSAPKKYVLDAAKELAIGYKDYNNTFNGKLVDTSKRKSLCGALTERVANREYNGRYAILNRGYSESSGKYVSVSKWDISDYEEEFGATEDTSDTNVYVDPVYAWNIIGGGTVQLTPSSDVDGVTYTYASSDTSLATVDETGLVTTIAAANGIAVITVTGSNGSTDTMCVKVIPTEIEATALSVTLADSSVAKYGITRATVKFEPEDTTDQTFTLTTADSNVKFYDQSSQSLVTSLTAEASDGIAEINVWVGGDVTDVTLTAVSTAYNSATPGTATISTTAGETTWCSLAGSYRGKTDIQSGKYGIWDGLIIDSESDHSSLITADGKLSLKSIDRMQTRNVILYIPVEGASTVKINLSSASEGCSYYVGESNTNTFAANSDNTVFTYTYDGTKTGIVTGAEITNLGTAQSPLTGSPVSAQKYLRVDIVKTSADVYITSIDLKKTGEFDEEAWSVVSAELSIESDFADNMKILDLNSATTTVTQTITASSSDSAEPVITYASSPASVAEVDPSTGLVTAKAIGAATITATVSHPTDSGATKKSTSYIVVVKDTNVPASYAVNLSNVQGATDSTVDWDFGLFSTTKAYDHASGHGWAVKAGGSITVHVSGDSTITIGCCQYGDHTANAWTVSVDSSTLTLATGEGATVDYEYTGEAADVTFTYSGSSDAYLHSIAVISADAGTVYAEAKTYDFRTDDYDTYAGYTVALNGFAMAGGSKHGTTYGWNMKSGNSLTLLVSGSCTITFLGSKYSSLSMAAEASAGSITPSSQTAYVAGDCSDTYVFTYTGTEATLTFTASAIADDGTGSGSDIYLPTVTLAYN